MDVVFRKPGNRSLLIVDDGGNPLEGVKVSSSIYWTNENPCRALVGIESLGLGISGADGRLCIPDGDFEYALEFDKPLYYPFEAHRSVQVTPYPPYLVTCLSGEETTIKMHRLLPRPLEMKVIMEGKPMEGLMLIGRLEGCTCGACLGAVSDQGPRTENG